MAIVVLYIKENIASSVFDHLYAFSKYSRHKIQYIDVLKDSIDLVFLNSFEAIVIHYTIFIFTDDRCPAYLRVLLRYANVKKIIFIQDEYRRINDVIENLKLLKIDCLFTCVPKNEIEKVYPRERLPKLRIKNTLTGYVSEDMINDKQLPKYNERALDVIYRARKLSAWYGTLCYEKWVIADKFKRDAKKYKLVTDISSEEKDRIYGLEWIRFLKSSKAALGVESGASVFDFTGGIQKEVEAYEQQNPKATFAEIKNKFFKEEDGKIKLNQISPRCFESAAYKTLMILYEGEYSGILKPWQHYIPLKKDHSNMEEIIDILRDSKKLEKITEKAYQEIALNPQYSYKAFMENFDQVLQEELGIEVQKNIKKETPNDIKSFFKGNENLSKKMDFRSLCFKFLEFLPSRLENRIEFFLRKIKRRFQLTKNTILFGISRKNLYVIFSAFKKNFCSELKIILDIKEYSDLLILKLGKSPLSILFDKKLNQLNISFFLKEFNNDQIMSKWSEKYTENVFINMPESFLILENLRGQCFYMKYPEIAYKFLVEF